MKPPVLPAVALRDLVARVFLDHEEALRLHAVAQLQALDVSRHHDQALASADDVLQNARYAALRNTDHFAELATDEARLSKAKTFVWNAVRTERDRVFKFRRVMRHVSDYAGSDVDDLPPDEFMDRVAAAPDELSDEFADARAELIAELSNELDRLTITLSDLGYEGQSLADEIASRTGRPYGYAAATARLSRVRARLARQLRHRFRP